MVYLYCVIFIIIMDYLFDLTKILIPAGLVFVTTYYLVKNFLESEKQKKTIDIKLQNQAVITPIRLQAYERIVLFLERTNPSSMVVRLNKNTSASLFQEELLKSIRAEFEHNLSQQIYMSSKAWEAVLKAKEETIKIVNVAAAKVDSNATGMDLAQAVLKVCAQLTEMPSKTAIDFIKKEISKEF